MLVAYRLVVLRESLVLLWLIASCFVLFCACVDLSLLNMDLALMVQNEIDCTIGNFLFRFRRTSKPSLIQCQEFSCSREHSMMLCMSKENDFCFSKGTSGDEITRVPSLCYCEISFIDSIFSLHILTCMFKLSCLFSNSSCDL